MNEIKKIILTKIGGVEITYKDTTDEENPIEYKAKSVSLPHPDLPESIERLKPIVGDCFMMKTDDEVLDRIKVKGVEWCSGNSVVIHWTWTAANETETSLVTPRIKLDESVFGFEAMLSDRVDVVRFEAESYICGKRAQLSLFEDIDALAYENHLINGGLQDN